MIDDSIRRSETHFFLDKDAKMLILHTEMIESNSLEFFWILRFHRFLLSRRR